MPTPIRARVVTALLLVLTAFPAAAPSFAKVIPIPAAFRVGPPQTGAGDGLTMRFKDAVPDSCSFRFCKASTDTGGLATTTFPNINYLLNQGTLIGPFDFGGSYFETRWDTYLSVKVPGYYVFSMQVDDGARVSIGDSTILALDGGHWFENVTSDSVWFEYAGSYPMRAYYYDCPVCCRGFRLGGMGPAGSGLMAFTPGFNFNTDLGPCCTFGGNGPGISVVPGSVFFRSPPAVSVAPAPGRPDATILASAAGPNPCRGATLVRLELARPQRVWAEVYDATGRRVATLSAGEACPSGTVSWPWIARDAARAGTYFYRARTEDGASASGTIVVAN